MKKAVRPLTLASIILLCAICMSSEIFAALLVQKFTTETKIRPNQNFIYYFNFINKSNDTITFNINDTLPSNVNLTSVHYMPETGKGSANQTNLQTGFGGNVQAQLTMSAGSQFFVSLNVTSAASLPKGTIIENTVDVPFLSPDIGFDPNSIYTSTTPTGRR